MLPFVMDLRDPWSLVERWYESIASPFSTWIASRHERHALQQAALVVMNTERARAAMQKVYPAEASRIISVMNGYDEDEVLPSYRRGKRFMLAYAGTVYLDRSPEALFAAAARLVAELELTPRTFGVEFMGKVDRINGLSIETIASKAGLNAFVRVHPPGSRREAAKFLARGAVLVSLPQDSEMAVPSKVFEYMRYPAWLLALARVGSATEILLRDTAADVVEPDDVGRIFAILLRHYQDYQDGESPAPIASGGRFSRRAQADILFDAIDRLLLKPRHAGTPPA
jgi:hypothetical protein